MDLKLSTNKSQPMKVSDKTREEAIKELKNWHEGDKQLFTDKEIIFVVDRLIKSGFIQEKSEDAEEAFRKVYCKEREPKKDGYYITSHGNIKFRESDKYWSNYDFKIKWKPEWWLEPFMAGLSHRKEPMSFEDYVKKYHSSDNGGYDSLDDFSKYDKLSLKVEYKGYLTALSNK